MAGPAPLPVSDPKSSSARALLELTSHSDGTFYGGSLNFLFVPLDFGKIFKLATNGTYTECFAFQGTNGSYPRALLFGQDGNLFGTSLGGQGFTGDPFSGHGTVFQLTPSGVFTSLVSFNGTNGSRPSARFVQGPDGNFYGTTESGGALDHGTLFRLTPEGDLTTLHSFDGTNGAWPNGIMFARDLNLYGTTTSGGVGFIATHSNPSVTGYGTIFRMRPDDTVSTLVFLYGSPGLRPGGLIQSSDGIFYGTTRGGSVATLGSVFRLVPSSTLPIPAFTTLERRDPLLSLTWTAFAGGVYQVEATSSLSAPSWTNSSPVITAIGSAASYVVGATGASQNFYRVRRE